MTIIPRICLMLLTGLLACPGLWAQESQDPDVLAYISSFRETAIREMRRTGVPAAIKLAQGILETEAGRSDLVQRSNNHFGIKCKSSWTGEKVYHDDDESGECFRKYPTAEDSWRDHSDFLRSQPRYASLFTLDPLDYRSWAQGLRKAGYATNPRYPEMLIKYIENYRLDQVTMLAMNGGSDTGSDKVSDIAGISDRKAGEGPAGNGPVSGPSENASISETGAGKSPAGQASVAYPSGEFKLNDTRVVYVEKGSSLLALAASRQVRLGQLLEFNDLPPETDLLEKPCLIYLQRKKKQGAADFHTVGVDETLHDIAQSEGIRMENLLAYNRLSPGAVPAPGQRLQLRETVSAASIVDAPVPVTQVSAPTKETRQSATGQEDVIVHRVLAGETLYALSKKYAVGIEQIITWNDLKSDQLQAGQQLRILKIR